jgi:hypothetical protein
MQVRCEIPGLNPGTASETAYLESQRGKGNFACRGKIRRDAKEHQRRRRLPG